MTSICEHCKIEFIQKREREPKRFCSRKCSAMARDKSTIKSKFEKGIAPWNKGLIGYRNGYKHKPETIEKLKKPKVKINYKTDPDYRIRKSPQYYEWRKNVLSRDQFCKKCGFDKNLHAHHIVSIKKDISKAFDLKNGILLCNSCHAIEHKFGSINKRQ